MNFFKNFEFTPMNIAKTIGVLVLALILLALASQLFQGSLRTFNLKSGSSVSSLVPGIAPSPSFDHAETEEAYYGGDIAVSDGIALSQRNIVPPMGGSTGDSAEAFEVTSYTATVETRDKENDCKRISGLKPREDVIFENANEYKRGCEYTFKVKNENAQEILAIVNSLDPRDVTENTYTIQQTIQDYTNEMEILQAKLASVESTLQNAISAYDEITALATQNRDAETLAKIIDSKLRTIEQLTQEKINITERLDRLERSKAQQLDRLDYTYFSVYIYENKFVDIDNIKDSWKRAVQEFITNTTEILQGLTVGLVAFILFIAQYLIYLMILLFVAKFAWNFAKDTWRK